MSVLAHFRFLGVIREPQPWGISYRLYDSVEQFLSAQ